jgi:hypothetical protein
MTLQGLHLLLTYRCIFECDHCFVWGGPRQTGTMTLRTLELALCQAEDARSVETIYFEGGEPFLYYPLLQAGVEAASLRGFKVGIVTNAYWATSREDAEHWLRPLADELEELAISGDLYHGDDLFSEQVGHAVAAAQRLGVPSNVITIGQPDEPDPSAAGAFRVLYRGRAAAELAGRAPKQPWSDFTACEGEKLREPGRLHLDPFGYLHICQGICIGNIHEKPLAQICEEYDPDEHPVVGPLLEGGPARLVERYGLAHESGYADGCHLCYEARRALREQLPSYLAPDAMYGSPSSE